MLGLTSRRQLLVTVATAAAAGAQSPTTRKSPPRLTYNDDGDTVVFLPHRVPMTVPQLTDLIDQFRGTHVDRYVFCIGNGRVSLHDTRVADRAWERSQGKYESHVAYRFAENAGHLVEHGFDPPMILARAARAAGLEYFLNLRMNDAHFAYSREGPEKSLWAGSFWHSHPEVQHRRRRLSAPSLRLQSQGCPRLPTRLHSRSRYQVSARRLRTGFSPASLLLSGRRSAKESRRDDRVDCGRP